MRFAGGAGAQPLIEALQILRELNATGTRHVPGNAPTRSCRPAWDALCAPSDGNDSGP
ncbi:hypothetical protein GCM10010211_85270 [Streptomyces albospinus]|uniref:Uncharacterized protein n=1 Tax=Streptomyces albospinus TaxID=285515 RepID=A0ABQ2VRY7_9ACTN|nr:hypothetical protein [Streptomyces albospinus]GGV05155.1 hypothetical protein GCM10010211_85270 [Streptomyces albospinus]